MSTTVARMKPPLGSTDPLDWHRFADWSEEHAGGLVKRHWAHNHHQAHRIARGLVQTPRLVLVGIRRPPTADAVTTLIARGHRTWATEYRDIRWWTPGFARRLVQADALVEA